jgi:hypothetical protein
MRRVTIRTGSNYSERIPVEAIRRNGVESEAIPTRNKKAAGQRIAAQAACYRYG